MSVMDTPPLSLVSVNILDSAAYAIPTAQNIRNKRVRYQNFDSKRDDGGVGNLLSLYLINSLANPR